MPVEAFGAASTLLKGEIAALFYRYKPIGGLDYVADMLIGPQPRTELATRHGDSGTLWVWDSGETNDAADDRRVRVVRPLAMQMGGGGEGIVGGVTRVGRIRTEGVDGFLAAGRE